MQLFDGRVRVANDTIVKITTFLTAAIPPLYNLVVGAALPTKKQQNLTNGKAVLDAYSTVLAIFSRTAGVSNAYPLRVGVYKLRSKLADVTITVSRPESLLLSKAAFKGGADDFMTATVTFAASDLEASKLPNIRNKCNSVIGEWEKVGLKSDIDRAYIAYRRIQPLAPTREAIIKCLGRTYAYSALPYQGKNHFDILADWQFTSDDIDRYLPGNNVANAIYGAQPQGWSKLNATMKYVVERAGRELRGNQADEFLSKFASKVTVEDETAGYGVLASLDPGNKGIGFDGTPQEVFIKLRSAGYQRWGCFVETDSAAGSAFKSQRNEAILTLAYKSSANEAPAVARASAVRVLFEGRVIRSLVFTDYFDLAQYSNAICPGRT
ncbi:MAG: hypothetical protein EOR00_31475 [Mesorhizobium sp.]|uniref:hypothetical protein n=1 Tax=Mesorhizobium sp. TaxID=1871066 RepID=UPI000FE556FF|nr:hypothetical protein [Mesorhizobium sp.]RWP10016.1 MAG: hypothetical protein EOR00_31475 [Mesorhizobium sp.]